jgi:hypothetical protein
MVNLTFIDLFIVALKIIIPNLIGIGIFTIGFALNSKPESKKKGTYIMILALVWEFLLLYIFAQTSFLGGP